MDKSLKISIIIPMWNGAKYLEETIQSVHKQNMQVEIIAVNDASTDNSAEIAIECGCSVLSLPRSGIAKTCNAGVVNATGSTIMILDQDDVLCENSLQTLAHEFLSDPNLQVISAKAQDFISPDIDDAEKAKIALRPEPYYGLMTGCVLLRKEVFNIVGLFNEDYKAGQAVDYMMRVQQSGISYKKIDFLSVMRRLHKSNTSRTMRGEQFSDYGAMLRAKLAKVKGK